MRSLFDTWTVLNMRLGCQPEGYQGNFFQTQKDLEQNKHIKYVLISDKNAPPPPCRKAIHYLKANVTAIHPIMQLSQKTNGLEQML